MRKYMYVEVIAPDGLVYEGSAESVIVATESGILQILPGHTNLLAPIAYSKTTVTEGGAAQEFLVRHGMLVVNQADDTVRITGFAADKIADIRYENLIEYQRYVREQLSKKEDLDPYQLQFLEEQGASLEGVVTLIKSTNQDN